MKKKAKHKTKKKRRNKTKQKNKNNKAKMKIMSECGIHVVASPAQIGAKMSDLMS